MKKFKLIPTNKFRFLALSLLSAFAFSSLALHAQDEKKATINLSFEQKDSTNICTAKVESNGKPVAKVELHYYVKSLFALLPVGGVVETDSLGLATAKFPVNLPGDKDKNIRVVVKIEDNDTYGSVVAESDVKWGIGHIGEVDNWGKRSLSSSREKAPMFLIIASIVIIGAVWGTIFYIILQVFKIRKASIILAKKQ